MINNGNAMKHQVIGMVCTIIGYNHWLRNNWGCCEYIHKWSLNVINLLYDINHISVYSMAQTLLCSGCWFCSENPEGRGSVKVYFIYAVVSGRVSRYVIPPVLSRWLVSCDHNQIEGCRFLSSAVYWDIPLNLTCWSRSKKNLSLRTSISNLTRYF